MKERPILFSAPMVRAILAGTKTQTRRVAKPVKHPDLGNEYTPGALVLEHEPQHVIDRCCPYGQPGDQLYVRETWMPDAPRDGSWPDVQFYGCKGSSLDLIPKRYRKPKHCLFRATWDGSDLIGWKPSIHMPRWASRIQLEITRVRIERLLSISPNDAIAEGIDRFSLNGQMYWRDYSLSDADAECYPMRECPIESYLTLWEQINGAGSWSVNPWVWVVEFTVLKGGAA